MYFTKTKCATGGYLNPVCGNKKMYGGPGKSGLPSTTGKSGSHRSKISRHRKNHIV